MAKGAPLTYASDELEAMAQARRYYRWILSRFRPYLGHTVLELGAGLGTFSAHLLAEPITRLILVEPVADLSSRLQLRFGTTERVELKHGRLGDVRDALPPASLDSVVAVNVLEHIPDDRETLETAFEMLAPGGALLLFVPALQFLFGSMDRSFGHLRRYTRPGLRSLLRTCGFDPVRIHYMNSLGVFSWLLAGRLFRWPTLTPGAVTFADHTLIPLTALLERCVPPPLGQSLLAIAHKP